MGGPLSGLRVIDLTDDLGRFATKLLAESGASVVRVHDGARVSHGPAMIDAAAARHGGLLDWWYEGGKLSVPLDLTSNADAGSYRRLAATADLIIDSTAPGVLAASGLDHADLVSSNPSLVQVSLTPFGRTGPRANWQSSDLVAAALGGVLSISGTADEAINPWGRQNLHFGSYMAAISGLAAIHAARRTGRGEHVDVSLHEVVASTIEQLWFEYWFDDLLPIPKIALRQGSLHWLRAYVVTQCKTGWCMISPTPAPGPLVDWMIENGIGGAEKLAGMDPADFVAHIDDIMALTRTFAATKDSGDLFTEAQARHVAFGEVQTVPQVAANPQFAFREFYRDVTHDGATVRRPRHPIMFHGTPADPPQPPLTGALDDVLADWRRSASTNADANAKANGATAATPTIKPLEGLRVLDFTWVLAGPFCNRMLGDLGADIVKLQTAERATLVNSPDFPYFYCWNRSKRSVALDMKGPGALDLMRKLVENADIVIENYSAGVLDRWGLDYETVRSWNPRIIYVTMSGCGHEGPWNKMITYAPTIHALCGMTWLSNPEGRGDVGAGFSLNDHAAGFTAAYAILAAIEARRTTGEGQHIDIAQVEVGAYLVGSALTDYLTNGREAVPTGNTDPYADHLVNAVFHCAEGELAVTVRDAADAAAAERVIGGTLDTLATWCQVRTAADAMDALQAAGVPAGHVQNGADLTADPQLAVRQFFGTFDSAVFGERPFDRFPARFSEHELDPYLPPPSYLGEHAFDVLGEIAGMDEEQIATAMGDGLLQ